VEEKMRGYRNILNKMECGSFLICVLLLFWFSFSLPGNSLAAPSLNFSDIDSGPKIGNTDGVGSGAIVTLWGNNLGSTQGTSKVYVGGVEANAIYYWKDADGVLPGGPADLKTYHKMQEIAFSIPAGAPDGATTIKVTVGGVDSNTLPFTVRAGKIYYIKSTGSDTSGTGTWSAPWATLGNVVSGNGKIAAGDIVYTVGVGASSDVNVGATAKVIGATDKMCALIVYPGTTVNLSGTTAAIRNFNNYNTHWAFSKFTITTKYQAFSIFGYSRYIGNKVTGNVASGYSGWIGGGCAGEADATKCSGHRIFGNEIYAYTSPAVGHHLYYISNRSGFQADPYEIGWNYHHDNPVYQGIHVYDQEGCGGWTGPIAIHDNVVVNQGGNSINIDLGNCTSFSTPPVFKVYNNIVVTNNDYVSSGYGIPVAAYRFNSKHSTFYIYNNTVYGYGAQNSFSSGTINYHNNILVDTKNIPYSGAYAPTSQSNNIFYSTANSSLALPSWATGALNVDPLFADPVGRNFRLKSNSPAINKGTDVVLSVVSTDFFGQTLKSGSVSIGACGATDASSSSVSAPKNVSGTVVGQ
jgi:uncharacterized protein (TIGR03437 family)